MKNYLTLLIAVFVVHLACAEDKLCPSTTKPHASECNKYLKCIELPTQAKVSWITLSCEEGLVYDKNLLSCAIPADNWECRNDKSYVDEDEDDTSREYLEVIDDIFPFESSKRTSKDMEDRMLDEDESSGDFSLQQRSTTAVTASPSTVRMITTQQLQRLTQLVQHMHDEHNGIVRDEISPDELNTFLTVQNIQTNSPDFVEVNAMKKTTMLKNGKIHPEILSNIIRKQNALKGKMTTLSMDETPTTKIPIINPAQYMQNGQLPFGQKINLESRNKPESAIESLQNADEASTIVTQQLSGPHRNPIQSSGISEDLLRSILEISKHMITQNNQEKQQQQQPVYYAVPVPLWNYAGNTTNYVNNHPPIHSIANNDNYANKNPVRSKDPVTAAMKISSKKTTKKTKKKPQITSMSSQQQLIIKPNHSPLSEYDARLKNYQQQQVAYQNYLDNQNYFYKSYQHQQPSQQQQHNYVAGEPYYQRLQLKQPQQQQIRYQPFNGYQQEQQQPYYPNSNGFFYGGQNGQGQQYYSLNRPFVIESSAPSASSSSFDYFQQQQPKRESYNSFESVIGEGDDGKRIDTSYDNDDEHSESEDGESLYDYGSYLSSSREDERPPVKADEQPICSDFPQRQANKTDCFKYYVCSVKTKEVNSYTCPATTAFNDVSKYCDAESYAACQKSTEAKEAKTRRKSQSKIKFVRVKGQSGSANVHRFSNVAQRKKQGINTILRRRNPQPVIPHYEEQETESEDEAIYGDAGEKEEDEEILDFSSPSHPSQSVISAPAYRRSTTTTPRTTTRKQIRQTRPTTKTKRVTTKTKPINQKAAKRKKKGKCNGTGNIPDSNSKHNYWHCFKGTDGRMKRVSRECIADFTFCTKTGFCQPEEECV